MNLVKYIVSTLLSISLFVNCLGCCLQNKFDSKEKLFTFLAKFLYFYILFNVICYAESI